MGHVGAEQLKRLVQPLLKLDYGQHLLDLLTHDY